MSMLNYELEVFGLSRITSSRSVIYYDEQFSIESVVLNSSEVYKWWDQESGYIDNNIRKQPLEFYLNAEDIKAK